MRMRHARAMTMVEMLLCIAVTAAAMGLIVLTSNSLRGDVAKQQTRSLLRTLQQALTEYRQVHGRWPEGQTHEVLTMLLTDDATRHLLDDLRLVPHSPHVQVLDGYDRPIRYRPAEPALSRPAEFISAGPDRQFGHADSDEYDERASEIDNLYGSEIQVIQP